MGEATLTPTTFIFLLEAMAAEKRKATATTKGGGVRWLWRSEALWQLAEILIPDRAGIPRCLALLSRGTRFWRTELRVCYFPPVALY
jgi:hypothetical protein